MLPVFFLLLMLMTTSRQPVIHFFYSFPPKFNYIHDYKCVIIFWFSILVIYFNSMVVWWLQTQRQTWEGNNYWHTTSSPRISLAWQWFCSDKNRVATCPVKYRIILFWQLYVLYWIWDATVFHKCLNTKNCNNRVCLKIIFGGFIYYNECWLPLSGMRLSHWLLCCCITVATRNATLLTNRKQCQGCYDTPAMLLSETWMTHEATKCAGK